MAIMTRMREGMPVILFGLLIIFMITIVFEWGMDYLGIRGGGRGDIVGKINAKKVTYRDFSEMVKMYADNFKSQTGKEAEEDQLKQFRDQAWNAVVTENLIEEQIKKLGLTVTDQELVDWVRGPNPPEDLRKNFIDSTGEFRRDMYEQFLTNPNQLLRDPAGRDQDYGTHWLAQYEKGLRQRRLNEKLQSIILASVRVSDGELRQRFVDQNQRVDALYILWDVALVNDAEVQLSDADLKGYYEENVDQYKFDATRKLKFVLFQEKPSLADSTMRRKDIEEAAQRARSGAEFIQLGPLYGEKADSGAFYRHGELTPVVESAVFGARVGDVVGPIEDGNAYRLMKVLGERKGSNDYIRASHILLPTEGVPDTSAVKREAEQYAREAKAGKDFASLAHQYSKDPGSASRGGDLGWFTKGRMVSAFENAAFKAKTGEIVGPIRSQFGWHIIKVTGRDNRELKLSSIVAKIEASSQTKNDLYERARDFGYNGRETEFTKEAQQTGVDVRETQVQEKSTLVPGLGINEAMTRWAFAAKVNEVSEPFTVPSGYVVATVTEAKAAGVRSFDEVKESLKSAALRKKKIEKTMADAAEVRSKIGPTDSLSRAEQIVPGSKVQQTGSFTVGGVIPGVGRDLAFLGAVQSLEPGKISVPVQGQRGALLIQVLSRTPFDSTGYMAQREVLQSRLLQEKKARFLADWLARLREGADIEDHRDLFYR